MQDQSFWHKLPRPLIGLAPMDGVTTPVFRKMVAKYGVPDVMFTEFVNADALIKGAWQQLSRLRFSNEERPIVAQIYGAEPSSFKPVAYLCAALGFDGVDVNMGCPARKITKRGAGAGLIRDPKRAQEIIAQVREGIALYQKDSDLCEDYFPSSVVAALRKMPLYFKRPLSCFPISIKTRIGFEKSEISEWIPRLLETNPVTLSLHGRTFRQLYTGEADWDEIAKAAELCRQAGVLCLGNGDLRSAQDLQKRFLQSKVDGFLLGRVTFGQPTLFLNKEIWRARCLLQNSEDLVSTPSLKSGIEILIEHLDQLIEDQGPAAYPSLFRHLRGYLSGFFQAEERCRQAFQAKSAQDLRDIFMSWLSSPSSLG